MSNFELLNEDQLVGYQAIKSGKNVYVDGKAGTGKSFLLDVVREELGDSAIFLAPTGIAALNISGATIHSTFGFPLGVCTKRVRNSPSDKLKKLFKDDLIKVIFIDEVSMVRADMFEAMDQNLRLVKRKNIPFGGIQVVCVGDFGQLSPVLKNYGYEREVFNQDFDSPYVFTTQAWQSAEFERIHLKRVIRQKDQTMIDHLGVIQSHDTERLEDTIKFFNDHCSINNKHDHELDDDAVFLCTTNKKAEAINKDEYEMLDGYEKVYFGQLNGKFRERPAPEVLKLKVGTKVMITANDNTYINGMVGYVSHMGKDHVEVMTDENTTHCVEPFEWVEYEYTRNHNDDLVLQKKASFKQIPLKYGYAVTCHKSQGLTLDNVVVDCSSRYFAHGQFYVALSRVKTLEGLTLIGEAKARDAIFDQDVRDFYNGKYATLLA